MLTHSVLFGIACRDGGITSFPVALTVVPSRPRMEVGWDLNA